MTRQRGALCVNVDTIVNCDALRVRFTHGAERKSFTVSGIEQMMNHTEDSLRAMVREKYRNACRAA